METPPDWLQIYNIVAVVLFTIAILIGAITTTSRLVRYLRAGETPPSLLWRDVIARLSLAAPFVAVLTVRVLGTMGVNIADLQRDWRWIVPTSAFAILGAWMYVYYEIFVIESQPYPEQDATEDREFGERRRELERKHLRTGPDQLPATSEPDQLPPEPPHP